MLATKTDLKILDVVRDSDLTSMASVHQRAAIQLSREITNLVAHPFDGVEVQGGLLEITGVRAMHVNVDPMADAKDSSLRILYRLARLRNGTLRIIVLAAGWASTQAAAMERGTPLSKTAYELAEERVANVVDVFRVPAPQVNPVEALV